MKLEGSEVNLISINMKILFDISNLLNSSGGGIHYYLKGFLPALISKLERDDAEIEFFNLYFRSKSSSIPSFLDSCAIHNLRFPVKILNKLWLRFNAPDLSRLYKDFDLVHSPHFSLPVLSGAKRVLTVHDITYLRHPEYFDPRFKRLNDYGYQQLLSVNLHRADHIIAISEYTKNDIVDYFNISPSKITTVYTGVDSPNEINTETAGSYLRKCDLQHGAYIYFPAGTLEPRKNIKRAVQAFLAANIPSNTKLVISGLGDISRLDLEHNPRVRFLRWKTTVERDVLYQNSLFVVYPSLYEGFGMPVVEAMSNGKAVLTSNTTSLEEIAGGFAKTVDPTSLDELVYAMEAMLNQEYRSNLAAKSTQRAKDFSWDKMANKTFMLYKSILS